MKRLDNKVCLITGGAGSVGLASAKLFQDEGARVALILTFNLETWDLTKDSDKPYYAGGPAILPDSLPANTPDFPNYTWREYGQRVGIWRLFELFEEMGVKASCTTNAVTFERRKAMTDAVNDRPTAGGAAIRA